MKFDINDLDLINIVFSLINLIWSIFALMVSFLLFYILLNKCDLKSIEIRLILVFSIVELISGAQLLVTTCAKLHWGYHWFDQGTLQCQIYAFIMEWVNRAEIFYVFILALWRYLYICHEIELSFIFWISLATLIQLPLLGMYIYGMTLLDAKPASSYMHCVPFTTPGNVSNMVSMAIVVFFLIPCWGTTYCYFSVGYNTNKKLNIIKKEAEAKNDLTTVKIINNQKLKLASQLVMVFVLYNVNFSLSYVTYIMKVVDGYKRPPIIDALIIALVHGSVAMNPIVTILFQPDINNEFKVLFCKTQAKVKK